MSKGMRHRERWLGMSGREAVSYGAVVSFRNAYGDTWSWTRPGPVLEVVRDACDAALLRDPSNLCVCISNPATIYGDLVGRTPAGAYAQKAECATLARAGRKHMIHPELRGSAAPR